jgi:tRNA (guanine37-N1)-methyltransferase
VFNQSLARELAEHEHLVIVTGHYEGVDERAIELAVDMEISLGDFVLTSGVLPAMIIADAVARLLPGVLGDDASSVDESHSGNLLEYPQYTRPTEFRGLRVPDVLMSGDHGRIAKFRQRQREQLTRERRPDMWENFMSQTEKEV